MYWVTTRGIKINRAATAWLIRRFIDPEAQFVFVGAAEVAAEAERLGGTGFHAPNTRYPARGPQGLTAFEAMVVAYCSTDEVLRAMSVIVRHADAPVPNEVPEAAGLRLITGSFPLVAESDDETVERSRFLYDALYAGLARRLASDAQDADG
jgi:hypothetical protein